MAPPCSTTPPPRRTVAGLLGGAALAVLVAMNLAGHSVAPRPAAGATTATATAGATVGGSSDVAPGSDGRSIRAGAPQRVPPLGATAAAGLLCASADNPDLAARLSSDIATVLRNRDDTVGFAAEDPATGIACASHPTRAFDSASAVKATILAAVLRRAQEQQRDLSAAEILALNSMIIYSDNDAATTLWDSLGRARFAAFLALAGMTSTSPGPGDCWGLTQITAGDELRLLDVLTTRQDVLSSRWKAYALGLMADVTDSQRWGTPFGTPPGVTAHVKNGWLLRNTRGWRVHSLGIFTGAGADYRMAVLTDNNVSMAYGIETIQEVAGAVNRDLARTAR